MSYICSLLSSGLNPLLELSTVGTRTTRLVRAQKMAGNPPVTSHVCKQFRYVLPLIYLTYNVDCVKAHFNYVGFKHNHELSSECTHSFFQGLVGLFELTTGGQPTDYTSNVLTTEARRPSYIFDIIWIT